MTHKERQARYRAKVKREAIIAYGGKCALCPQSDEACLEFHHEHGAGGAHRRELFGEKRKAPGGWHFLIKLRQAGWPQNLGIQILCTDCHTVLHPHRGDPYAQKGEAK